MLKKTRLLPVFSISILSAITMTAYAETADTRLVIAPTCLVTALDSVKILSQQDSFVLIETNAQGIEQLIAAKATPRAIPCGGFVDVNLAWDEYKMKNAAQPKSAEFLADYVKPPKANAKNFKVKYKAKVEEVLRTIDSQAMWGDLSKLTSFDDRYANSNNGVAAAKWIKEQVEAMAKENGREDVSGYFVETGNRFKQPSVVIKVGNSTEDAIVIGAHMDTLSSNYELKPGADDDGSGSATVLGVARTVLASGLEFKRPIYFVWYSAEEEGLIGSSYVVKDFMNKKIGVHAVMQMDMTGYAYQNDQTMWLITDNVNQQLTSYLQKLINTYVHQTVGFTSCGYACSDHASWDQHGFTAAFPFEAQFGHDNPYIHTGRDKLDFISLPHMTDYAKLGTAFAVELGEPLA